MAKGDHGRAENALSTQGTRMQDGQNSMMNSLNNTQGGMQNRYDQGSQMNLTSYDDIMGKYNSLYNNPFGTGEGVGPGGSGGGAAMPGYGEQRGIYSNLANNGGGYGWDPGFRGAMDNSIAGYQNFADTGGFSGSDISNIRARSIAPIRGVYGNAQNELSRSRSLGGSSPNFGAAQSRMAREMGNVTADAATNAEAGIAQMVQQGKLAGLGGLSSTGAAGQGLSTDIDSLNAQMKLAGLQGMMGVDDRLGSQASSANAAAGQSAEDLFRARMGILGGQTDLFGTTPAYTNTTGNQLLGSGQNLLAGQGLQNQLGMGMIQGTQGLANIPGNFQQAMGNIGSVAGLVGSVAGGFGGLGSIPGLGSLGQNKSNANPWQNNPALQYE